MRFLTNMQVNQIGELKKSKQRLVGLEFENPLLTLSGNNVTAAEVQLLFKNLIKYYDWKGNKEKLSGNVLELNKIYDGANINISTDCGWSSLEVAFPPKEDLHQAQRLQKRVFAEIILCLKKIKKVKLSGIGLIPGRIGWNNKYKTTKPFYNIIKYFNFHNINIPINAHQTGVSINLNEAVDAINELTKIGGLVIALCANSTIENFKIIPWKEWRVSSWQFVAITKYPGIEKVFGIPERPVRSIADYFKYYWSVSPCMFITPVRKGSFIDIKNKTVNWMQFLKGHTVKGINLFNEKVVAIPQSSDINVAGIVMWPHAKLHAVIDPQKTILKDYMSALAKDDLESYIKDKLLNFYIEFRIGATPPPGEELALPALTLGLVNNLSELKKFTNKYSWDDWKELTYNAAVNGLDADIKGQPVENLARKMVSIARHGLKKRKMKEEKYLSILDKRLKKHENPADEMRKILNEKGKKALLNKIFYD